MQVRLLVTGSLPTPCHRIETAVEPSDERHRRPLWSGPEEGLCATVLEPFEVSIPLGAFEAASLPVTPERRRGRPGRGRIAADREPAWLDRRGLVLRHVHGLLRADLVIDGDEVVITGSDRSGQGTLYTNRGRLTAAGRERLDVPSRRCRGCPSRTSTAAPTAPTVAPPT